MDRFCQGKYLGSTRNELQFEGNLLCITTYHNCPDSEWHFHENSFFTFVLNGGCREIRNEAQHLTKPGDLLFYKKGMVHRNSHYEENSRNLNLELNENWLKNYDAPFNVAPSTFFLTKCDMKFLFVQLYQEYMEQDPVSILSLNTIVLEILAHLSDTNNAKHRPAWVPASRELLLDNWSAHLSLNEIASEMKLHPVTISKNFQRYFGCTLGTFIRKYRIEKALTMIRTTDRSLTDIALECGFADQSHFTRSFKKFTGTLPLHYRKI
jgi:AraC family transcriptional regulator